MFRQQELKSLLNDRSGQGRRFLGRLLELEGSLKERFVGLDEAVHALILAVASGEPLLLIGPPGTAKSYLARLFCRAVGLLGENNQRIDDGYFEYLLTPFTEPGELFGFYDLKKLAKKEGLVRVEEGMLQKARVVFLDEVFNASSAILNSLLAVMNERLFHDRGQLRPVAMQCLIGATNRAPETAELKAFYDRFLLRSRVENIPGRTLDGRRSDQELNDQLGRLLDKGWRETYGKPDVKEFPGLLDEAVSFRRQVGEKSRNGGLLLERGQARELGEWRKFLKNLAGGVVQARDNELSEVSNRRLVKMTFIMLIERLLRAVGDSRDDGRFTFGAHELSLLPRFFLDRDDEEDAIRRMGRITQHMS